MQEVDWQRMIKKPSLEVAAKLFHKTQICPNYLRGQCFRGDACNYAHGEHELKIRPNLEKTKLCNSVDNGLPCLNPQCGFAHHPSELKHTNNLYKTSLCIEHSKGFCKKGDLCRYAHGQQELRTKEENQLGIQKNVQPNPMYPKPVQSQRPNFPQYGVPNEYPPMPYFQFPPQYPQFIPPNIQQGMPLNQAPPYMGMFNPMQPQFIPYPGFQQTSVNNKQADTNVF